jgi:transcriptional regulator with XRE-family HTH domain
VADRRIRGDFERRVRLVVPDVTRDTRRALRWSQDELGRRSGVPQSKISRLEAGNIDRLTFAEAARLLDTLGVRMSFAAEAPFVDRPPRQHDAAHARCVGYVARQLTRLGWSVRTELEIIDGSARGWADVVAIDIRRRLFVGEVKAGLRDFGAAQRQVGWYGRTVPAAVRAVGWRPASVMTALLVLATTESDDLLRQNRDLARVAFPTRAPALLEWLSRADELRPLPPGLALVDPRTRRRQWLVPTSADGRRSRLRYASYADFMVQVRAAEARYPPNPMRHSTGNGISSE